ncbi:Receptor-like serine/threonine-protein kinase SD1-8 [Acorus gramineus]|uniref:Receptor-like serine/threonine-protein kinase SD1-8 n=1 Tax=Acorus gramineus TaxID=55184 RepID=A0AAV8ZZ15_ACOGR|nr:Receptor-like serine/threonine-protein kinase SD1-8 [Acorus gramineus]
MGLDECAKKCLMDCACTAYATSNISNGIGCLNWFGELIDSRAYPNGGQDLYVRLAASDLDEGGHKKKKTLVGVIVAATVIPGILLLGVVGYYSKRRRWLTRKLNRRVRVRRLGIGRGALSLSSMRTTLDIVGLSFAWS